MKRPPGSREGQSARDGRDVPGTRLVITQRLEIR